MQMSFLFILDIMSTTGYVNMTAEELRRLRKSILRRLERLAETHIRPVTQEGEKVWVHLRDVMTGIILQVGYPGQGLVLGSSCQRRICEVRGPEHHIPRVPGVSLQVRLGEVQPRLYGCPQKAERVLLSERRMIEAETEQARKGSRGVGCNVYREPGSGPGQAQRVVQELAASCRG